MILELSGGLGNQMFQYAAARKLQLETGEKIFCNLYAFEADKQRKYALQHFQAHHNLFFLPKREQKRQGIRKEILIRIFYKLGFMRGKAGFEKLSKWGLAVSFDIYAYYPLPIKKNMYLKGNFQSWKYFAGIRKQLIQDFSCEEEPDAKNKDMLNRIRGSESVCVHIRRGDYITNRKDEKFLNICGKEYYQTAIDKMKQQLEKPVFFIFSNTHEDLIWVREHFELPEHVVYADMGNSDYQELRLMSACRNFIISNSTFSWWAQYLSENAEKIVIAPGKWNREKAQDASDIYMDNWQLIDVK